LEPSVALFPNCFGLHSSRIGRAVLSDEQFYRTNSSIGRTVLSDEQFYRTNSSIGRTVLSDEQFYRTNSSIGRTVLSDEQFYRTNVAKFVCCPASLAMARPIRDGVQAATGRGAKCRLFFRRIAWTVTWEDANGACILVDFRAIASRR